MNERATLRPLTLPPLESVAEELLGTPAHDNHIVQFYESEDFLYRTVAHFLRTGLDAGEPLLVIATPPHREAFCQRLELGGVDVEAACRGGLLTLLDAREMLSAFMVDGRPDWPRFRRLIGDEIAKRKAGREVRVRAYGEMVDLLWSDGNPGAAIALEQMWNDIGRLHSFSLLCAYVMGNFYKEADGEHFHEVCRTHSHVIPAESFASLRDDEERNREISLLQQRARSLQTELEHRKELERALREALRDRARAEASLRDFVENAVYGLHWVDADGKILWANRAEMDLLGYRRDEYVGHHISEFHADPPVIDDILRRLARNETLQDYEARLRCKDGSLKHVLIASNVFWEDDRFVHTRCFTRDITARKQAEETIARAQEERSRALELERAAREEAERTVRYNEMFAGILGHDLRNPLSAITTGAHYLIRLNGDPKVGKTAARILSSADRMARMIEQLLDFTRLRVGEGLPVHPAPVELSELCFRVKEELEAAHPDRSIALEARGSSAGDWDADRLLQVFSNILGNAVQHGAAGAPVTVRVDGKDRSSVTVEVHNAGAVPPALLAAIFEPFRGSTRHRGSKGLGLGLFITRQIVMAHGGTIEVRSSEAAGTTFEVRLPRTLPEEDR